MKLKNIFFLSFILSATMFCNLSAAGNCDMIAAGIENTTQNPNNNIILHTVAQGENVYSIANKYSTTVKEIYRLNPKAENGIRTGEKLNVPAANAMQYSDHRIEAKETLYSVAKMYNVSENDIKKANPGIDENNFRSGRLIRIPKSKGTSSSSGPNIGYASKDIEYKVQKKETLYGIARKHNISEQAILNANPSLAQKGLKEGMTIFIPRKQISEPVVIASGQNTSIRETPYAQKGEMVRVGVLLPFLDKSGSVTKDKLAEYYQGFLIALKEMKSKGLNAEVYAFDIGPERNTKKLESLLDTYEMQNLHLIIGGVSKQQIDVLTKFSKKTGIKYAIPFGTADGMQSSPTLYQLTTSHSALYSEVISAFKDQYEGYNIIFVNEAGSNNDKSDFTNELKKELTKAGIQYKTTASTASLVDDVRNEIEGIKRNVLVPTSSSEATLRKVLWSMNSLTTEAVTLFGYPEWQTYTQYTANLHKYDSEIYSIFFLDEQQNDVKEFVTEYKLWYNKNLVNSFPKYGYLGYDTGLYFLTALSRFGSNFESNIPNVSVKTLQSAIHMEQSGNNGGYVNKGIYLIRYKTDSTIEKIDISR
ncbi:LysM peptidoglycan-binding domain-containing protein [Prevotella sp. 10(H)]|uniref:LysM peptidoglycan-binding domain-containing protein n=1 Tax=Prevotella sp. 10(H) TaxID=1158294 RepID=UPI0004A6EAE7|nr:LysM peptidoglycan-binding domain-containing protein [Prevotella sp. 10(H)]